MNEELQSKAAKLGLDKSRRHVFLCTGPRCCTPEAGQLAWDALKNLIKELGLTDCQRNKVGCLRICCQGPTMVVYPEGTWYHSMTADNMPRLVLEHLIDGKPIQEWIFAEKALSGQPFRESQGANCPPA